MFHYLQAADTDISISFKYFFSETNSDIFKGLLWPKSFISANTQKTMERS